MLPQRSFEARRRNSAGGAGSQGAAAGGGGGGRGRRTRRPVPSACARLFACDVSRPVALSDRLGVAGSSARRRAATLLRRSRQSIGWRCSLADGRCGGVACGSAGAAARSLRRCSTASGRGGEVAASVPAGTTIHNVMAAAPGGNRCEPPRHRERCQGCRTVREVPSVLRAIVADERLAPCAGRDVRLDGRHCRRIETAVRPRAKRLGVETGSGRRRAGGAKLMLERLFQDAVAIAAHEASPSCLQRPHS